MGHQSEERVFDVSLYADAHNHPSVLVPIVRATPETLFGFGNLVTDYDSEDVIRSTWPKAGWRPIAPGTGNLQVRVTSSLRRSYANDVIAVLNKINRIFVNFYSRRHSLLC